METANFDYKNLSCSFTIKNDGPKRYGRYIRNGQISYRKYSRELKNGKGITLLDVLIERSEELDRIAEAQAGISVFHKDSIN